MDKPVYIVGDVHGKWEELFTRINDYSIKDCYVICVGDLGIGFKESLAKEIRMLEIANTFFGARDIQFLSIRGNHDNPAFFNKEIKSFSNLRLIPDYHVEFINDQKFLFVGGAVSIDRKIRKLNSSYWEDELFVLKHEFVIKCDVLITHSAPIWIGPVDKEGILGWCDRDQYLWRDCIKERDDHTELYRLAKPEKAYMGHFHQPFFVDFEGCRGRILAELEIIEHRK